MTDMLGLIETWGDTVADDAAIKAWSQTNYSRDHNVFTGGTDEDDPPEESEYPIVVIGMDTKRIGFETLTKAHSILVICGISKKGYTPTGKANQQELTGVIYIETFRKLVENAITGIYTEGTDLLRIDNLQIEWSGIAIYPFFFANMAFDVNEDEFQGTDVWL